MPAAGEYSIDIMDALVAEVESQSPGLPTHTTVKYRRPVAVFPEDCPLLVCSPLQEALALRTTEWFDGTLLLGISWQEEAVQRATQLVEDPERAKQLVRNASLIARACRNIGRRISPLPTVDVVHGLYPTALNYLPGPEVETGLVEGYLVAVQVDLVYEGDS